MVDRVAVAILARAPVPGQAKTRLIPALGAEGAARLQSRLIRRAVTTALAADVGPVALWCAGDPHHPEFDAFCGAVVLRPQPEGDLGARMAAAMRASPTAAGTLVIGTDCPGLSVDHLRRAAQVLSRMGGADAVVYPAEDGGYVLIGMRRALAAAFVGIDWGTRRVMAQTRERLAKLGQRWEEPETLWDVDRPADLVRLAAEFPDISPTSNFPPVIRLESGTIGHFQR